MAIPVSPISIRPKVWVRGDRLYARTSYPAQALTLFAFARHVHVDRGRRIIKMQDVRWWVAREPIVIAFERVAYIDSKYADFGVSRASAGYGCWARKDKWERFTVGLVLREPAEEVRLFRFTGSGTDAPNPGGLSFDSDGIVNAHGDQGQHVRFFVEKLQEFLQVPVGAESGPIPDAQTGVQYECSICKRPSLASRDTCWMCGSPIQAVIPALDDARPPAKEAPETDGTLLDLEITPQVAVFLEETANANG